VRFDVPEIPAVTFSEAEDAVRRTPYDESNHSLPMCFVCGPARAYGDGLRIHPGPLSARPNGKTGTFAAAWVPYSNLASDDGGVGPEFIWAVLDCPTGYACLGARHFGLGGAETILLGRMSAQKGFPKDWKTNASAFIKFVRDHHRPSFLEYGEYPYVSADEIKQALKLKAAFSNMLDQMQ
jgi:hypothetical protein